MKTLVRPKEKLNITIPVNKFCQQNQLASLNTQYRKSQKRLKLTILILSLSTFLFLPETPEKSASSCLRFNSEAACNIW